MENKISLSVILPIKSAKAKDFDDYFAKAINSLKEQKVEFEELVIVHTPEETLVSVHKSMALDITKKRLEMMEASTAQKANVEIKEIKSENGEILGTKVILNLPLQYIK